MKIRHAKIVALLVLFMFAFLCRGAGAKVLNTVEQNGKLFIGAGGVTMRYDLFTGRYDLLRSNAEMILSGASSDAELLNGKEGFSRITMSGQDKLNWFVEETGEDDALFTKITITRALPSSGVELINVISFYKARPGIMIGIGIKNVSGKQLDLVDMAPVSAMTPDGALFLGLTPENARVFRTRNPMLQMPPSDEFDETLAWSHLDSAQDIAVALHDPKANRGFAAGFVTRRAAVYTPIELEYVPGSALKEQDGVRTGWSVFRAHCRYLHRIVKPGETISSETFAMVPSWDPPLRELAEIGLLASENMPPVAAAPGVVFNTNRNSIFTGGAGEPGWAQITVDAELAADALAQFGLETIIFDAATPQDPAGWALGGAQPQAKEIVDRIHARKLKAGVRISPLLYPESTEFYKAHKHWFMKTPSAYFTRPANGTQAASSSEGVVPDATVSEAVYSLNTGRPDVRTWLISNVKRLHGELGLDCIELSLYPFIPEVKEESARRLREKTVTERVAALRALIADAAGPDVKVIIAGVPGEMQPGAPVLQWEAARPALIEDPSSWYMELTRVFFMDRNLRIYSVAPARGGAVDASIIQPAGTRELLTAAAMVGVPLRIYSTGNARSGFYVDDLKKLLPSYHAVAQPFDLFDGPVPEKLNLRVAAPWGKWNVVALFNWGVKFEEGWFAGFSKEAKTVQVSFRELVLPQAKTYLLYDFWNDEFLGAASGSFTVNIPYGSMRVIAVREAQAVPQLLSSNRHITMGGIEIPAMRWDEASTTLSGTMRATPGFAHRLTFFVPAPFKPVSAVFNTTGVAVMPRQGVPGVYDTALPPDFSGDVIWSLSFSKQE